MIWGRALIITWRGSRVMYSAVRRLDSSRQDRHLRLTLHSSEVPARARLVASTSPFLCNDNRSGTAARLEHCLRLGRRLSLEPTAHDAGRIHQEDGGMRDVEALEAKRVGWTSYVFITRAVRYR